MYLDLGVGTTMMKKDMVLYACKIKTSLGNAVTFIACLEVLYI